MYTLRDRCNNHKICFPDYPPPIVDKTNRITGIWYLGSDYRSVSSYYGSYPVTYLNRLKSLFPEYNKMKTLHLFSGSMEDDNAITFDIRSVIPVDDNISVVPDVNGDAEELSNYFRRSFFDLILADPPYSEEDAEHYGQSLVNRNKVMIEAYKVLRTDGFICWLDQVLPMYTKKQLKLIGTIGIIRSTNHRVRAVFIYQKLGESKSVNRFV